MRVEPQRSVWLHLAILSVVPVLLLVLYTANPVWRIYSDHGFLHQSIVFALINGEVPPNSPILADQQLLYLWGHHYVVAIIAKLTNLPLSWIFAGLNILALSAALWFAYIIGSRLRGFRLDGLFAALLAIVGCNIMSRGLFVDLLESFLRAVHFKYDLWEYRELVVAKFYNLNSNGLGIAAVLAWLLASTEYCTSSRRNWWVLFSITASASAVGFLYPVYMPNVAVAISLLFVFALVCPALVSRANSLNAAIATAAGLLISVPYVLSVSEGRVTPAFGLADFGWFLNKSAKAVFALGIVAILIFCFRRTYSQSWKFEAARWLLPAFLVVLSVAVYPPIVQQDTEYKHLLIATVAAGVLAGPAVTELLMKSRFLAIILLAVLATPFLSDWLDLMNVSKWPALTPVVEDGAALHSPDPEEDALYRWVQGQTDVRDAFVDDRLLMPVLGQRALYFGIDRQTTTLKRVQSRTHREFADGWEWRPEDLVLQQGYDPKLVARRKRASLDLLTKGLTTEPLDIPKGRRLFLVARTPALRAKLIQDRLYQEVYSSKNINVYDLGSHGRPS